VTESLIAEVTALGFQQANNLLTNLLKSLDKNNTTAACGQLAAFITQVQAQSGKSLTVQEAALLIDPAVAARGRSVAANAGIAGGAATCVRDP